MNYLPSNPETELTYPLARQGELVITHHTDRSYKHGILLVGLTDDEVQRVCHAILHAQTLEPSFISDVFNSIGGGLAERSQIEIIAKSNGSPLTSIAPKRSTISRAGGKRKRIQPEELETAQTILLAMGSAIDGKSRSEILELTSVDKRLWQKVSGFMLDSGLWRFEGERRDRRYFWNGG